MRAYSFQIIIILNTNNVIRKYENISSSSGLFYTFLISLKNVGFFRTPVAPVFLRVKRAEIFYAPLVFAHLGAKKVKVD